MPDFYTEACDFLNRARALLATGDCEIAIRPENEEFTKKFGLKDATKRNMLMQLTPDDCVNISPNDNPRYAEATVYTFHKNYDIERYGEMENVPVYAKMYIRELSAYDIVIVISLHEDKTKKRK